MKGAKQITQMCTLVCVFVVRKPPITGFLASRPIWYQHISGQAKKLVHYQLFGTSKIFLGPVDYGHIFCPRASIIFCYFHNPGLRVKTFKPAKDIARNSLEKPVRSHQSLSYSYKISINP